MIELLAENMLLLVGLVVGAAALGLKLLAKKTENTLDDKMVEKLEENKDVLANKIADLINSKLLKKEAPKADEEVK